MIANTISYDSASKNVQNFCYTRQILNSFFDFSCLYLSLFGSKGTFWSINICSFCNRLDFMEKKKYRAVMIANAILYESALKNAQNFCSTSRILNSVFDFSSLYLFLFGAKETFWSISICSFGNRLKLTKKIARSWSLTHFRTVAPWKCL